MNRPESDSSGANVNFIVDADTHFKRTFYIKESGVLVDCTYWEGEFVVFYPRTCKEIFRWDTNNGDLQYTATGTWVIDELIDVKGDKIDRGTYECYLMFVDGDGLILKYITGKFIVE